METPIYIAKLVGSHERREALNLKLHCEHWNGVPISAFTSRRAATDFCRWKNKHQFGFLEQHNTRMYYVVAITILNHY